MDLKENVAFVTGAASWIGLTITRELLKEGIKGVLVADINSENGEKVVQELKKEFGEERVTFFKLDIRNYEQFEDAIKNCLECFGRLDIIVNNAGIGTETNYLDNINTNLIGTVTGTKLGLKYLAKDVNGRGGIIINISSIGAFEASHIAAIYCTSKSGVVTLVRAYGHSYHYDRTGVKVIGICPGRTLPKDGPVPSIIQIRDEDKEETMRIIKSHENQKPEAIGRTVCYVLQHASSGSIWICEGGRLYKANIPDRQTFSEFITDFNLAEQD